MYDRNEDRRHYEFLRMFASCAMRLHTYISCLLPNQDDAEEVFQQVSFVLWNKFDQFDPSKDFFAWSRGIAYLEVCNFRRATKRRLLLTNDVIELIAVEAEQWADGSADRQSALSECLGRLPERDRELLTLRYHIQLKPKEIAQRKGRSTHAIYRSLTRIHNLLLRCVKRSLKEA